MIQVFRICQARYGETALSGEGGLRISGRWHPKGVRVVYGSESRALAALEQLVQRPGARAFPALLCFTVGLPDAVSVKEIGKSGLPQNWRDPHEYPPELQRMGAEWLRARKSVALRVPSVIVPEECNVLLNPRHPEFRRLKIGAPETFAFDSRLT